MRRVSVFGGVGISGKSVCCYIYITTYGSTPFLTAHNEQVCELVSLMACIHAHIIRIPVVLASLSISCNPSVQVFTGRNHACPFG